jgi:hypothetical protein
VAGIENPVRNHQQSHEDESDIDDIGQFHMRFDGAPAILVASTNTWQQCFLA